MPISRWLKTVALAAVAGVRRVVGDAERRRPGYGARRHAFRT
jgi:hypothetical protein